MLKANYTRNELMAALWFEVNKPNLLKSDTIRLIDVNTDYRFFTLDALLEQPLYQRLFNWNELELIVKDGTKEVLTLTTDQITRLDYFGSVAFHCVMAVRSYRC